MKLSGTVKDTQIYGAIVDLGLAHDGLVHISQISSDRVNRVADAVQPGDAVTVWVTKVDAERGRIGLTMVEPPDVTWNEVAEGEIYMGTVTRLEPYGAFVDIGCERDGLLHVREMAEGYVRHPSEVVRVGEEVEVRVSGVDRRRRRIDLSMLGLDEAANLDEIMDTGPMETQMEIALRLARAEKAGSSKRGRGRKSPDLSDREDILERTLRQHGGQ
jgi:ribosomal protein S1